MDPPHVNPYNAGPVRVASPVAPGSVMASPTSVEFALDLEDYLAWNWHKISTTPYFIRQQRIHRLTIPLLLLLVEIPVVLQLWDADLATLLIFGSLLPVLALIVAVKYPEGHRRAVRKNATAIYNDSTSQALHGPRKLELSPVGIRLTGKLYESIFRWPMVVRIDVTERCAFLDIGGFGGIIVPRSAFGHDAIFEAFVATARRFQQAAQDAELVHPEIVS